MNIGYLVETPITKEKKMYGAQISFVNLLREFKEYGVNPFVVVSEEWEITDRLREFGVEILVTPIYEFFTSVDGAYGEYHDSAIQERQNAISQKLIQDFFEKNNVELVHMNTRFCGLLGAKVAREMHIPYIYHIREFLEADFGLVFKDEKLANELIGNSTILIAISESISNYLRDLYPNTKIELIYNGINVKKYACPKCNRFRNNVVKAAIVGRVISHKGQLDAIKAIETLAGKTDKKVELLVVGIRPDEMTDFERMLVEYVDGKGLNDVVKFIPFTDKVEEILKTCDIGLMCSKREAFGRVTVEYMLSNLLVIGSDSGGTPEIISNKETGLLYKEGDYISLAKEILWAVTHIDISNNIISAGYDKAISCYSSVANAKKVYDVYRDILG